MFRSIFRAPLNWFLTFAELNWNWFEIDFWLLSGHFSGLKLRRALSQCTRLLLSQSHEEYEQSMWHCHAQFSDIASMFRTLPSYIHTYLFWRRITIDKPALKQLGVIIIWIRINFPFCETRHSAFTTKIVGHCRSKDKGTVPVTLCSIGIPPPWLIWCSQAPKSHVKHKVSKLAYR